MLREREEARARREGVAHDDEQVEGPRGDEAEPDDVLIDEDLVDEDMDEVGHLNAVRQPLLNLPWHIGRLDKSHGSLGGVSEGSCSRVHRC